MTEKQSKPIFYFLACLIFIGFCIFISTGDQGLFRLVQLKNIKNQYHAQNLQLMEDIILLSTQQKYLHNHNQLKPIIHKQIGWISPNEEVFLIPKE